MKSKESVIDPIHVLSLCGLDFKDSIDTGLFTVVKQKDSDEHYYSIQKGEDFDFNTKPAFIKYMEKSFELIHPAVINLSGYSFLTPILYYKYTHEPLYIDNIELSDENIQIIFIGIASGLSYLLSKNYYISDFTIQKVIFGENSFPKLIDYINFTDLDQNHYVDMIQQYAKLIQVVVNKKMEEDSSVQINEKLKGLLDRCEQDEDMPTFEDFVNFFKITSYRTNHDLSKCKLCTRYYQILANFEDKIIYDDTISQMYDDDYQKFDSIEQICYYFYNKRKEIKVLNFDHRFLLNSLPEYYLKQIAKFLPPLTNMFKRYLYNDDLSLVIPNWKEIKSLDSFQCYKELMKQMSKLEKQKNDIDFYNIKAQEYEYKIEAIRIKAIELLKDASEKSENANIKIELAVQYVKGDLLPYNLSKASDILKKIKTTNNQTKTLINQMKEKIRSALNINVREKIPDDHIEKYEKAEQNDIFSMLYIGFSFYTGFNNFPIIRSLSIQYYRKAAKLSPYAMLILGFLYLKGVFFPKNLKRARNCFRKASENGCYKAEFMDCLLRKHIWRTYLLDFDIDLLFDIYLPVFSTENDSYYFQRAIYLLEKYKYLVESFKSLYYHLRLEKPSEKLTSDSEVFSINMVLYKKEMWRKNISPAFSEEILIYNDQKKDPLYIGKSYYYGINNYPVNYSYACKYLKISAESGNSEAQWRYAMMLNNGVGDSYCEDTIMNNLAKSSEQSNLQGKFYYALLNSNPEIFEKLIKECIDNNHLDAMYHYGMYLEKNGADIEKVIEQYKKASDQGHIDSFIRLINIYNAQPQKELFESNLMLSVGILNESLLIKLIKILDENKNYDQSNILIQIGIKLNHEVFNYYYFDHLLYGKGIPTNIERARKLLILAIKEVDQKDIPVKYIFLLLQAYALNNEHEEALGFLLKFQDRINENNRNDFHLFYQNFDKNIAKHYLIPACFYYEKFKKCHEIYMTNYIKNKNSVQLFTSLVDEAPKIGGNPFAMALVGKLCKQGKPVTRNLRKAIKYFECSAQNKCPLGYYYIAKEFYYGRYINQDYDEARKYFLLAIENNDVPQAGYYIFKISTILSKETEEDVKLLQIGAKFGHKRALYKYGHRLYTGYDKLIPQDKEKGEELIQQASYQKYKKAVKFCLLHGLSFKESKDDSDSSMDENDNNLDLQLDLLNKNIDDNDDYLIDKIVSKTTKVKEEIDENEEESNNSEQNGENEEESNNPEQNEEKKENDGDTKILKQNWVIDENDGSSKKSEKEKHEMIKNEIDDIINNINNNS